MPIAPDGTPMPYGPDMGGGDPLAALLGGGGAPPMEPPAPEPVAPSGGDAMSRLKDIRGAVLEILQSDGELSEQDKALVSQAESLIGKILAAAEKDMDSMLQGKISPAAMRRATVGAGPS